MTTDDRKRLGARCEALAADYLAARGYAVIARNFRCPLGEVDLICLDGATVVFVEVKARRSARFGGGFEAVDGRKQRKLMAIAELYMSTRPDAPCRFDVVSVKVTGDRGAIEHLPNAFP